MTEFEFIFVLYALVLGLSLVELLSGFGRTLENEFETEAQDKRFKIGLLTPLLGVFVLLDLLSFWIFAWAIRDIVSVSSPMLLGVIAFASAYYLAARLVFPTKPERFQDLDTHYYRVRRTVMGILIALVLLQWAYLFSVPEIGERLLNPFNISLTVLFIAMMAAAMVFRDKRIQTFLLIALSARYLFLYLI